MKLVKLFQSFFSRELARQNTARSTIIMDDDDVCSKEPKEESSFELNHLPDLCLLAIFTCLPQADLITVGRVCTRWKSLVLGVSNKITTLTISIDNHKQSYGVSTRFIHRYSDLLVQNSDRPTKYLTYDQKKYTKFNSFALTCAQFNLSLVKKILFTFHAITSLELSIYELTIESLNQMVHLLAHYHPQLISIKLICWSNVKQFDCSPLFVSLNRKPSPLRILLIELNDNIYINDLEPFSILSQLEQFYINSANLDWHQLKSMEKLIVANANLSRIGFGFERDPTEILRGCRQEQFCSRITHLVDYCNKPRYLTFSLTKYCDSFTAITNANVELDTSQFLNVLKKLSKLRKLMYLKLKIYFWEHSKGDEDDEKALVLLQLPSVRIIEFDLRNTKSFSNFESLRIPYHFPRVEVIQVMFCGRPEKQPSDADEAAIYDHLKTECPRLHHLYERSKLVWSRQV